MEFHDTEAEQAVLGSLIYRNDLVTEIASILQPEHFYNVGHQSIYKAMLELETDGQPIDEVLLADKLTDLGKLQASGGRAYLAELIDFVPSSGNVAYYANIVLEHYKKNEIAKASNAVNKGLQDGKKLEEVASEAISKIEELTASKQGEGLTPVKSVIQSAFEQLEVKSAKQSDISGLRTGLVDLDKMTSGLQNSDLIIIAARPSMGKAQPLDAKILLKNGQFCNMGSLKIGDELASIDGEKSVINGVFPQGKKEVFKITMSDGRATECCKEHLWEVMYREWDKPRVVSTEWLIEKLKFKRYKNRLFIQRFNGDYGEDKDCFVDPYLLGLLLGDGSLSGETVKITTSEVFLLNKVKDIIGEEMLSFDSKITYRLTNGKGKKNELRESMVKLGLMGHKSVEKFIPKQYLKASKETRISLLRGLIDTDGTVEKSGAVTFSTSSTRLKEDFVFLCRSLGFYTYVYEKDPHFYYKGEKRKGQKNYVVFLSGLNLDEIVSLPRKKERLSVRSGIRQKRTNIGSIESIGMKECQCISVSHGRSLYITDDFLATHNTAISLNIANEVAKSTDDAVLIFSLEMSKEQLINRILSAEGKIDSTGFRSGNLAPDEWDKLAMANDVVSGYNMHICDKAGINIYEIRAECKKVLKSSNIGLVLIDYLQLMRGTEKNMAREQEIAEISRELKALAKELDVPVIALSQLNRSLESRADKRPMMSDLRESGAIEQDADIIAFIYRDEVYNQNSDDKGKAELIIGKHRNGSIGKIMLSFTGKYNKFANLAQNCQQYDD